MKNVLMATLSILAMAVAFYLLTHTVLEIKAYAELKIHRSEAPAINWLELR